MVDLRGLISRGGEEGLQFSKSLKKVGVGVGSGEEGRWRVRVGCCGRVREERGRRGGSGNGRAEAREGLVGRVSLVLSIEGTGRDQSS